MNIHYTKHAVTRFAERFPELLGAFKPMIALHMAFKDAREDRSLINNSEWLVYQMEKYGDYNSKIFVNGNVCFIVHDGRVITCIDRTALSDQFYGRSAYSGFRKKSA